MPVSSQAPSHLLHPDAYSGHPDEMGRDPVCITGNVTAQQDLPALQAHGFQIRGREKVWESI